LHSKTVPSVSNLNFNFNIIIHKLKNQKMKKKKYLEKINSYSFRRFHLSKHLTVPQFTLPECVSNATSLYKVLGHEVYYCVKHETNENGATQKMRSSAVFLSSISITYLSSLEGTFLTNRRNPHGNKLCPSSCRAFTLLLRGRINTKTCQGQKNYRRWSLKSRT
jgi:hypothetical protein